MKDFRPISCCNTIYKFVTKVICRRLRKILSDLIMENQRGFCMSNLECKIPWEQKSFSRVYAENRNPKTYNTINWEFLRDVGAIKVSKEICRIGNGMWMHTYVFIDDRVHGGFFF